MLASLTIAAREWIWPAVGIFGAGVLLALFSYWRSPGAASTRTAAFFLRTLGLAALAVCLVEPRWTESQPRPGANTFAIVADNSQGMKIQDNGAAQSRSAQLHGLVAEDKAPWQMTLAETFQLRRFLFDNRLTSTRDFSELNFEGRASAIHTALADLGERYRGQPLAGILLLTDGNATDLPPANQLLNSAPVYPVLIGKESALRDLSILSVSSSETAFEDAPVTVQAEAQALGFSGEALVAEIVDSSTNAAPIVAQEATPRGDSDKLNFRFQFKPPRHGLAFYKLRVRPKIAGAAEATRVNNDRTIVVDRGGGPYQILYVGGRPSWDFKFLNRAMEEDDQVRMVSIIRIARREPKFTFRGRTGEESNPLFRGFGGQDREETERFDQPVLIRLKTRDEKELRGGFPKTAEELYAYHAVIIDDLEADFFTADQQLLIQRFVADRGGGLLMMGGPDSLAQGKYYRTPIGDSLPVYLTGAAQGKPPEGMKMNFTREGWLQPWARLRGTENEERARLEEVPPYTSLNRVGGLKPGAQPIATATDDTGKEHLALAVQRFGKGRTAAVMIADLWHGALGDEARQKDLAKAWRQLGRWLTTDVPEPVTIEIVKAAGSESAVTLRVRARDKTFKPADNAMAAITVEAVGTTNKFSMTAEASATEAGVFETVFAARDPGGYRADVTVTDNMGQVLGRASGGWAAEPLADEFRSLQPNRALLETIARQTGGEVITADKLPSFVGTLKSKKAPILETVSKPVWDKPFVFLFALGCFAVEWGLRRARGLA